MFHGLMNNPVLSSIVFGAALYQPIAVLHSIFGKFPSVLFLIPLVLKDYNWASIIATHRIINEFSWQKNDVNAGFFQ
jgi:hypothetical protein